MNSKYHYFIRIFFLFIVVNLCLVCGGCKKESSSGVLGRTICMKKICDDFEDENWKYDRTNNIDSRYYSANGFWWGPDGKKGSDSSNRGDPAIVERIPTPKGGKIKSTGALKIGTNIPDDDNRPTQDDFCTIGYEDILKCKLVRSDQPVFVVRVLLPPFNTWGEYYSFGFRQSARSDNTPKSYYPSIWLYKNPELQTDAGSYILPGTYLAFRIFSLEGLKPIPYPEFYPIKQYGWWTLAIAFDENGVCSYYAYPGTDASALTEENKIFDDVQFMKKYGKKALLMQYVHSGLFSLGYRPEKSNANLRFAIDDYEVWIAK